MSGVWKWNTEGKGNALPFCEGAPGYKLYQPFMHSTALPYSPVCKGGWMHHICYGVGTELRACLQLASLTVQ